MVHSKDEHTDIRNVMTCSLTMYWHVYHHMGSLARIFEELAFDAHSSVHLELVSQDLCGSIDDYLLLGIMVHCHGNDT